MIRILIAAVIILLASLHEAAPWKRLTVDPWGNDTFRIRFNLDDAEAYNGPGALTAESPYAPFASQGPLSSNNKQEWNNGNLALYLNDGVLHARRADGQVIASISLSFDERSDDVIANTTCLNIASAGSKNVTSYYGFGEHENGKLDHVFTHYDMETCTEYSKSKGGEICLPWVIVADDLGVGKHLQFGVLWNVPAYGAVEFGLQTNRSIQQWTGFNVDQVDILLTTFSESVNPLKGFAAGQSILNHYVDAVGHAPELPEWASGYWHSKNRYKTQDSIEEVMDIFANNYSIPVSVYVVDYKNWHLMGDLTFDPVHWPNPKGMVEKARTHGAEIMVSTWPFSNGASKSYAALQEMGLAVFNGTNRSDAIDWPDGVCGAPCRLYDASNPKARQWWWSRIKEGYFDYGIKMFWLDASEPEQMSGPPIGSSWSVGSMQRVGMMFPWYHAQTYYEGMIAAGVNDGIILSRSAWVGLSKYRAAVWNGDTRSNFTYLATAIQSGLSIQMSGIAWWTTDIGGYAGGNAWNPAFRELIVRWFQFGLTSPLFRQHGARSTEPWLLGEEAFANVRRMMALREDLRPYVLRELTLTAETGLPLNRPLFFDYPSDEACWVVADQFMFGREFMVAPVYEMNALTRSVYFPEGENWCHYFTGQSYAGGQMATIDAPLAHFPLFRKSECGVIV